MIKVRNGVVNLLYGIKKIYYKKNGILCESPGGRVKIGNNLRSVEGLYIDIKTLLGTLKFTLEMGGSHPNPAPHIRLSMKTKYFLFRQNYGNYTETFQSGTAETTVKSVVGGNHLTEISITNMPLPAEIGVIQNTIQSPSMSNYLYTDYGGNRLNTQFWDDDSLINVSMEATDYEPTWVLKISRIGEEIKFTRLLP
jgi:hypothetical protein